MENKMRRYLSSLGLSEPEKFDLSFLRITHDSEVQNQIDMAIQKETPWDYSLLVEFQTGLANVRYPYRLDFYYATPISFSDERSLFFDWYLDYYHGTPSFGVVEGQKGNLKFVFADEEEQSKLGPDLTQFGDLLRWLGYPNQFEMETKLPSKQAEEAPAPEAKPEETQPEVPVGEEAVPQEEAPAEDDASEFVPVEPAPEEPIGFEDQGEEPQEEGDSAENSGDVHQLIEQSLQAEQKEGEDELLQRLEENRKKMEEERNKARVFHIGDYIPCDTLADVYKVGLKSVDFSGEVYECDVKTTKKGKKMAIFGVGDPTDAISVRAFEGKRFSAEAMGKIAVGQYVRIRGAVDLDFRGNPEVIAHFVDQLPPKPLRDDPEPEKRVELHLHTTMSTMDGVGDMGAYYALAKHMGMKAIAVTDHGVVQGFPAAQSAHDKDAKKIKQKNEKLIAEGKQPTDEKPLKILYGAELNLFDLEQQYIFNPCDKPLRTSRYVVFDTETTGLSARYDRILEFGGVLVERGGVIKRYDEFIKPDIDLKYAKRALEINKITEAELQNARSMHEVLPEIIDFLGDNIIVAHNATFDVGFLNAALEREHEQFPDSPLPTRIENPIVDTLPISHYLFPEAGRHNEGAMLKNLGLNVYDEKDAHRADYDAEKLNDGWQEIILKLDAAHPGIRHCDLQSLTIPRGDQEEMRAAEDNPDLQSNDPEAKKKAEAHLEEVSTRYHKLESRFNAFCRHLKSYHCCVLVKNTQGLQDLYRIITEGETTYLERASVPKCPRSLLRKYRSNFMVGSACFNGEVFQTALTRPRDVLVKTCARYDYIEIQPIENYSFQVNMGYVQTQDQLIQILRDIVSAAHEAGVPVVATGDCHYVNPEDKILRDVYISAKGVGNGAHPLNPPARSKLPPFENPDQHFRSTKEMLDSFETWMDEKEAREIVIKNSNWVADQIRDDIVPMLSGTYPPNENLPHSDKIIRELCEGNFHKRYDYLGTDNDPKVKEAIDWCWNRLQTELTGIIGNGYAVTYYIAHLLIYDVEHAPERYIVGSRGSVGSSFAATLADITEVNALPPFWQCPHCHYLEFNKDPQYKSGFDLPERNCPKCGTKMRSDGQNIPFQTFLGFKAEKVPDIDLNFEDKAQKLAHQMTKVHLGAHQVYRAGTIETVAEKTAFGYVKNSYFEDWKGMDSNKIHSSYIAYLAAKCQGVKRTTGQHPGGIVVVPKERNIFEFTAVQHPADDLNSEWLTTHYDYHSMHDELLKFDILGHVDPMAMRYYRDLTGVDIRKIPMNDEKVLSLFRSPAELKLHRNYLNQKTGALALPEFGTPLAQQMLEATQPHCFNDLLIISGLAHGTDVWGGNAEELIKSGTTDLHGVIGCRDDIMSYMISLGIDNSESFKIMEDVRHGKGLKPEYEADMRAHHVPDYYIASAKKIKYLFPRGHATAYVTMAVRVAYFKLYYPLEFYAVFFSIRSDDWDIKTMLKGEDAIIAQIQELEAKSNDRTQTMTPKDKNILKTDYVALEMYERGYKVENIDLYKSQAKLWVADHEHGALIPAFSVLGGLGEAAAQSVVDARANGQEFLSKEDLLSRTKLTKTNVQDLSDLGALGDMGETNQMSLF